MEKEKEEKFKKEMKKKIEKFKENRKKLGGMRPTTIPAPVEIKDLETNKK